MLVLWPVALQVGYFALYLPYQRRREWLDGRVTITDVVHVGESFQSTPEVAGSSRYQLKGVLHLPDRDVQASSVEQLQGSRQDLVGRTRRCTYDPKHPRLFTLVPRSAPILGSIKGMVLSLVLLAALVLSALPGLRGWGLL